MLIPVQLPCNLKYAISRLPGALNRAWLEEETHFKLLEADRIVVSETGGAAKILVWDALRSFITQKYIFDTERKKLKELNPGLSDSVIDERVSEYVRPPLINAPPPHTTGGAVDVTLWWDGNDTSLGDFDDFTERGSTNFFEINPPTNAKDADAASRRRLLRRAMTEGGFVGIPNEWWHYEFGTRAWAAAKNERVIFDQMVLAPVNDSIAARLPHLPARQVVDVHGAAQAFGSPQERLEALRGVTRAYYYARTRHHNERQVVALLTRLVGADDAILMPSGLCAVAAAVFTKMPPRGTLVVDRTAYYESRTSLSQLAQDRRWNYRECNLSDQQELENLRRLECNVVFCDHPRNWLLTNPNLAVVREICDTQGATLIVDTSVQPLQKLIELNLADVIVLSLSKYPSAGETIAGAILGTKPTLDAIRQWCRVRGVVVAPETSATLLVHLPTMSDRLEAISRKAKLIYNRLLQVPTIKKTIIPDLSSVQAECGGQLCFQLQSAKIAQQVEEAVGWNTSRAEFPLALACTFGALFTTFEHFDSRNIDVTILSMNSDYIDPGLIRLGIGYESVEDIIDALEFVLYHAKE